MISSRNSAARRFLKPCESMSTCGKQTHIGTDFAALQISGDELLANLAQLKDVGIRDDNFLQKAVYEYQYSWGVRGDNNIHNAEYLGYMLGKDLYPDLEGTSIDEYIQELLDESS